MNILYKLKKVVNNPLIIVPFLGSKERLKWLPDKIYLKATFRSAMSRSLNLKDPQTFNEKIQWLKLYDRNPLYTNMVDKYEVRNHIAKTIGEEYLIPMLGYWDKFEQIDFTKLPNQFVLKTSHDSGGVVICKDKSKLDIEAAKNKINNSMKRNYYYLGREWPYKNVKPRILCEKYMVDESITELKDYKFMCFNGEPKIIQVMSGRKGNHYYINHFDLEWNRLEIARKDIKENSNIPKKPDGLKEMIEVSRKLSKNIPFSRIDLYETKTGVYFGEIIFFPAGGYMNFEDEAYNYLLGSYIRLPLIIDRMAVKAPNK